MRKLLLAACLLFPMSARSDGGAQVSVDNFTFSPATLTVAKGTEVTWTNQDDIPHSIVAKQGAFRSKVIDTEGKYSFTFASAGEFAYFCGLHPHMTGTIVVTP